MPGEIVKLKGSRFGLELLIAPGESFSAVKEDLQHKLESGSKFFRRGTIIHLAPGSLTAEQEEVLRKLFRQHGVMFRVEVLEKLSAAPIPTLPLDHPVKEEISPPPTVAAEQKMLVINRTVRGGQEIITPGSVLICGNVNPGAQVIAGGSIDIRGVCRGMVHAGAHGDTSAFIIADRLMPVQIRIADKIARSPDGDMKKPKVAERASIKDGKIIIDSIER